MQERARARLRVHLQLIEDGVAPVAERYAPHIECKRGCSDCCHQTFRVSEVEGAFLREGLEELRARDPGAASAIERRARVYAPDTRQPCPVLDESGACSLYEHRPRICRKYGIPLWSPKRPHEVATCPKNFQGVGDLDPALILDPQAHWAEDWIALRTQLALGNQHPQTIAAWLSQ